MEPIKITLSTKTPPSKKNGKRILKNRATGKSFIASSENHEIWHEEFMWKIRNHKPKEPYKNVKIEILFYPHDRARCDCTNKAETIMDLLADSMIIEDDNWFVVPETSQRFVEVDKENPRVEIIITPL